MLFLGDKSVIQEEIDDNLSKKSGNCYTITKNAECFLLRKIRIKKTQKLLYGFIGGMWYTTSSFSFNQDILIPYPFTTYFTYKIPDKLINGMRCRSLLYVKTPLIILQFADECIGITFDPHIHFNQETIIPFMSLNEDQDGYTIFFYLCPNYEYKTKNHAWLGRGTTEVKSHPIEKHDTFTFSINIKKKETWEEIVKNMIKSHLPRSLSIHSSHTIFKQATQALFRSYDQINGTFLQLPWRKTPGFTFVHSSYSLLSYDAVRLHYFTKWYNQTQDPDFLTWKHALRNLFVNPDLYQKPKIGKGIIWYNMTNQTKQGLEGFFYLDCGYAGYPGGQATIAYHLLKYLTYTKDQEIKDLVIQSMEYLLSTQQEDGSYPMAIKQTKDVSVRRENLQTYVTSGGTGECIRALLEAYRIFEDDRYKHAAEKALEFLDTNYPICMNGLRDIGIQEPEAFSAISIIDAYLDAYQLTEASIYLERAITYGMYTTTWFYLSNLDNMEFKYNFHPISYSITPRLSPFESSRIVSTFKRLGAITKDDFWTRLADVSFHRIQQWVTKNGGLSEGVFPINGKLKRLPMEQTFATVELMNSCTQYTALQKKTTFHPSKPCSDCQFHIQDNILSIDHNKRLVFSFDVKNWKIYHLGDSHLDPIGITISFYQPYTMKNRIKQKFKQAIRGPIGKYVLGVSELKYIMKGVSGPKPLETMHLCSFENIKKESYSIQRAATQVHCECETAYHHLSTTITVCKQQNKLIIHFSPITIKVLDHDLSCQQVLYPLISEKLVDHKQNSLKFKGFTIKGSFPKIITDKEITAIDQTLASNWTHGGIFQTSFDIIISLPTKKNEKVL